jgi:hypothetical protein
MVEIELAEAFLGDIQNRQIRKVEMKTPRYFDSVGSGEYRFDHQQINASRVVFHNVMNIGRGAGFQNCVTFQTQNLPKHRAKRVVIIDK